MGPTPAWLQENDEPEFTFSVPGTAGPARSTSRPTRQEEHQQVVAAQARVREAEDLAAKRRGEQAAARRWPERASAEAARFLGECWALIEFVEAGRGGGAARKWVEQTFLAKAWHISVNGGYTNELREALTRYYREPHSAELLACVACRAGEYIAGLEAGARSRTVDLDCYEAWRRVHFVPQPAES